LSISWSARSSEAKRNCRAQPLERFAALAVDEPCGGAEILFLALTARDLVAAPGDVQIDEAGHLCGRLADEFVELFDNFANLGAKLLIAARRRLSGCERALNASERLFRSIQCC
jgi:hypothetical protein